jgi:predicted PurR-regulated permease PerM
VTNHEPTFLANNVSEPTGRNNLQLTTNVIDVSIRVGLLLLLAVACFNILSPFMMPVLWGVIIAVAIYPLFARLRRGLGNRNRSAAVIYTLLALALLILPTLMIAESAIETAGLLKDKYEAGSFDIPPPTDNVKQWPVIGKWAHREWTEASVSLTEALRKYEAQLRSFARWLAAAAAGAGIGILQFVLSIIISGILVANAGSSYQVIIRIFSRLAGVTHGQVYTNLSRDTIRSVAQGVLGVAIIQAVAAGLGMFVMDVPGWGLWTLLLLVLAVAQLPPLIVMLPVMIYVFSVADTTPAVIFAIYSVIVSASDGFLKPLFLGRGMQTPMLVILLGAIGGMISAGIIGLFIGAIVLALGYELFMEWLGKGAEAESGQQAQATDG